MIESIKGVAHYPLGIGMDNFANYSGTWRQVHVSYLQIAVEGGIGAFVLYLLFFGRGFGNLKQLRRLPINDPEIDLFSGALYASLVGFVVGAFFAPEAYQYFPYFAVAYTSVLLAIATGGQVKAPHRQIRRINLNDGGKSKPEPAGLRLGGRPSIPKQELVCFETNDDEHDAKMGCQARRTHRG